MTQRYYTYKVTFPHQGWWYWGVHREKKGDNYAGSPVTHKDKWDWFEFEIQILEYFDDWDEARSVEKRLIKPDLNNPMCLNENAGGGFSREAMAKAGTIAVESGQLASVSTLESRRKGGKTSGRMSVESGRIYTMGTLESRSRGGRKNVESGNIHSIKTPESLSKGGKAGGKTQGKNNVQSGHLRKISNYRYKCLVTGYITTAGPLTHYQRARGIDPSLRERVYQQS